MTGARARMWACTSQPRHTSTRSQFPFSYLSFSWTLRLRFFPHDLRLHPLRVGHDDRQKGSSKPHICEPPHPGRPLVLKHEHEHEHRAVAAWRLFSNSSSSIPCFRPALRSSYPAFKYTHYGFGCSRTMGIDRPSRSTRPLFRLLQRGEVFFVCSMRRVIMPEEEEDMSTAQADGLGSWDGREGCTLCQCWADGVSFCGWGRGCGRGCAGAGCFSGASLLPATFSFPGAAE
ncbi:hypothetical protein GALMADRAFT_1131974 [Galerina marginata CBS 339.88]|uniref:Uncharacterized protein n=1 Tax=Galerina marginata (strain CBS 339.88) TaxID=685588 RepID=A0A067SJR9_GALM3|nr:hypothetical protein GALMADRAFT_1131974 [Galerina marginata CBS 339.88]